MNKFRPNISGMKPMLKISLNQNYEKYCVADKESQEIVIHAENDDKLESFRERLIEFVTDSRIGEVVVSDKQYNSENNEVNK